MPARRLQALSWSALFLGLTLTYVVQDNVRRSARLELEAEFDFRVNQTIQSVQQRLHNYEQILEGSAGLFAASQFVDRSEFREFVSSLKLEGKYPGIQGVGFSELVLPQDKARHLARIRAEGFRDYDIRPTDRRDVYTSIIYLEPFNWRNQRAFGYDMYSDPVRRLAMEQARDEDRTSISGKVRLLQETEQNVQPGFLMYLPVFRPLSAHQTVAERRANLIGWVYAPFRMSDLMGGILGSYFGELNTTLDFEIFDGATLDDSAMMFDSYTEGRHLTPVFHTTRAITVFGHQWTIQIKSLPAFDARQVSDKANIVAGAGIISSTLLAALLWLLLTGRARALAMAESMTAEVRQGEARQQKLNRALRLLSDCNTTLVHAQEEYKLLVEICRLCVERGNYVMAWVGYAEQDQAKSVRPIAQSGYENGYLDSIDITWADSERGQGPTGTAIRTGKTNINQNVQTNPLMAPWRETAIQRGYQSSIALPLISDAQVLGALSIYAREADAFNDEELKLLEELATDLAYGIVTLRTRTEHAEVKEKVAFLAHFDPLTHLPNRLLLRDRFDRAVVATATEHSMLAMLYLDLDNFQKINDGLGHEIGDQVLIQVARRLQQAIPARETISRLGGDEFIVLLSELEDASAIVRGVTAIQEAFTEPVAVNGHLLNVSFSIGISLYPDDGQDFDTLLKCADTAANSAKESGRNTYRLFTRKMNGNLLEQMALTAGLLNALRKGEFILYYQPQVAIDSGRIIGAEALIRWQHPVDGLVPPAKFIPLAEQSGHIVAIGEWVLHEACRQAKYWLDEGKPLVIAVNLSALQFKNGNVSTLVANALAISGLPPQYLELELTESILLQDVEATVATLHSLKQQGVKLSIDDFGTGYSSLSYLKQLAVDKLKIDQSFIHDMLTDPDGASIVKAIIQLGHTLQLEVIAEGVETDEQRAFLAAADCDEIQGYLISRPVPPAQFIQLIEADTVGI